MLNKIMIVGDFKWDFYEKALMDSWLSLNINVIQYKINSSSFIEKLTKFKDTYNLNKTFTKEIIFQKPDILFIYRINDIFPSSFKHIKKKLPNIKIMMFHNDNPYIGFKNKYKYFYFLNSLKYSDITYVYRSSNIKNAINYGAKNVKVLYPHYYSKQDINNNIDMNNKKNDVIFIGHYEKDRAEYINELIKNNIDIKVFGPGWEQISQKLKWPNTIINKPVYGNEYKKTLASAKIALCFLSKVNNDVYTRRNFEIPVSGTLVVSEYTKELSEMFISDKEIIFFKNCSELVTNISNILNKADILEKMTLAGYKKVLEGHHSELDRAIQIINDFDNI